MVAKNKITTPFCDVVIFLARGPGFEPRYAASKATVLPLDDPRLCFAIAPQSEGELYCVISA